MSHNRLKAVNMLSKDFIYPLDFTWILYHIHSVSSNFKLYFSRIMYTFIIDATHFV